MKKMIILLICLSFAGLTFGQQYERLHTAFSKSYLLEQELKYKEALEVISPLYQETSYDLNIRFGWLLYNMGNYPESKKYYQRAMNLLPYSLEAKFGYVLPLAGLGMWDEVVKIYESMLQIDPKNTVVNYRLGLIYYERKDYQKSYNYLEAVINLYPNDADSNILFAWTNYQMGKLKEAKILFNKVLLISPDNASAKEGLALIK